MTVRPLLAALTISLAALATGAHATSAADVKTQGAGVDKATWEARSKFIRKCLRDRTKSSCEAPEGARVTP